MKIMEKLLAGKRNLSFFNLLLVALFSACLCGCGRQHLGSQYYKQWTVQVVDSTTKEPVAGAKLNPLCMGGTPFETNTYETDSKGIASIWSNPAMVALRIQKEGYQTNFPCITISNYVVSLNRLSK
ncbi:MAG TPA: hypothetical protein VH413_06350 [Verrucomicrobiae bacterium]|jgi:hypothetical protein|nr:hypothetical protein [Verrucomicrobiae bacterium]